MIDNEEESGGDCRPDSSRSIRRTRQQGFMKRNERRHLKENELQTFARDTRERLESKRREVTATVAIVAVLGVLAVAYFGWREHTQTRSAVLLADAVAVKDARIGPPGT